jgi:hypothetical protein
MVVLALAVGAGACSKKSESRAAGTSAAAPDAGVAAAPAPAPAPATVAAPRTEPLTGPRAVAVATPSSVAFAVPQQGWWMSVSMPCYNAATAMSPGVGAFDMFAMQYPWLAGALRDADIDIKRDPLAMGAFECSGELCMYAAAELKSPDKVGVILERYPGDGSTPTEFKKLSDTHFTARLRGAAGPRTIHLVLLPIDWSGVTALPDEAWAKEQRRLALEAWP